MSLVEKTSLFDRNQTGVEGSIVGTNAPGDGAYFRNSGQSSSPFLVEDHLKELLINSVQGQFSSYQPSIHDLNGEEPQKYLDNIPT